MSLLLQINISQIVEKLTIEKEAISSYLSTIKKEIIKAHRHGMAVSGCPLTISSSILRLRFSADCQRTGRVKKKREFTEN